jgi:phage terminase large subunit-like protein
VNLRAEIARLRRDLARMGVGSGQLSEAERAADWDAKARPEQRLPSDPWGTLLLLGGRGSGKTTAAAEGTAALARDGRARRIAVIAQTAAALRNVSIAALQEAVGPALRYYPSNHHKLVFPSGAIGFGFSATKPDSLRGHQFDLAWADEAAAYPDPGLFDQLAFALRAPGARLIISTTPRPSKFIRDLLADPSVVVTRSRTWDNAAYLDPRKLASYAKYEGTRLGLQELEGEVLDDPSGGLWEPAWIDRFRVTEAPALIRLVVAIDPALGGGRASDETGIIVVGKSAHAHGYVLADLSGRMSPDRMARVAVGAYREFGAEQLVAEENLLGGFLRSTIESVDPTLSYRGVRASQSKLLRAAPIAALYEQGRVHHVGTWLELEDQLCTARLDSGSGHDDRLDALVWALTDLNLTGSPLDVPGAIAHGSGIWNCPSPCKHPYSWGPGRPCPKCGRPAPMTYDHPVDPGDE